MSNWNSKRGVWTPAKEEEFVLKNNPDGTVTREIYRGPDRAALEVLKEEGVDHLGQDAKYDPEIIMRARTLNMTVDEFLKLNEPLTPEQIKAEESKDSKVVVHDARSPKKAVKGPHTGPKSGGFGEVPA